MAQALNIYPIDDYTFGVLPASTTERSPKARLESLELHYGQHGMATGLEAVLVVHNHGHPHLLVLQTDPETFLLYKQSSILSCKLNLGRPSGTLEQGESELEGMQRLMEESLAVRTGWKLGDLLAVWWRPNFEIHTVPISR